MNPKTIFFLILIFGCAGSLLLGFFLVAVSAGLPSTCVQASHCNDFSCCRALVLGHMGSGAHGLSSCSSWALEHRLNSCGPWA